MKSKKGISLIVLVITIIVMIILAGAIILSLNNSGIIGSANEAVKKTDEATVKELAQMAWAEAYASGVRHVEDIEVNEEKVEGFQSRVDYVLESNGVDRNAYKVTATLKGVKVQRLPDEKDAWKQEGLVVKRGEDVLTIGQTVKYVAKGTGYKGEWKVLGADEIGNLLIMSASDIKTGHRFGYEPTQTTLATRMKESQKDWLYGSKELDNICITYGNGEGAIESRSITLTDINKITKFDPMKAENEKPAANGSLNQYNNIVTYKYNKTTQPSYSGENRAKGTLTSAHTEGFYYYDGNAFKHISVKELTAEANDGKTLATLTSNGYIYEGKAKLDEDTPAYKMIFGDYDEEKQKYTGSYWLASPYTITGTGFAIFGMRHINNGNVTNYNLLWSNGSTYYATKGVRAVVTLSWEVLTENLI